MKMTMVNSGLKGLKQGSCDLSTLCLQLIDSPNTTLDEHDDDVDDDGSGDDNDPYNLCGM